MLRIKLKQGEKKSVSNKTYSSIKVIPQRKNLKEKNIEIKNNTFNIKFSNKGAKIVSLKNIKKNIELTVKNSSFNNSGDLDFPIHFSDREFIEGNSLDSSVWSHKLLNDKSVSFQSKITIDGNNVVIEKKFTLPDDGHGVRGVDAEVQKHLSDLAHVPQDNRPVRRCFKIQDD